MGAYYSFIKFRNSNITGESVAIGMVLVQSGLDTMACISENKMKLANIMNPNAQQLLKLATDQFMSAVKLRRIDIKELERLHVYQNGIIEFTKPSFLNDGIIDHEKFMGKFSKWITGTIQHKNSIV